MESHVYHNRLTARTCTGSQIFTGIGTSGWINFTGNLGVQITGSAQAITVQVERSSLDPAGELGANPAPADAMAIQGNPATGIPPVAYFEPGNGWWRVNVIAMTGGSATITLSGSQSSDE